MRKRIDTRSAIILGLLGFAALLLPLAPTQARAAAGCGDVDSDLDGFTDYLECTGIPLTGGGSFQTTGQNVRDLFVILVRATPSNIPSSPFDPFALARNLGINIQVIEASAVTADRLVSPTSIQKAVKITEDLSTSVVEVGSSTPGIPSGRDEAKIYTIRIWQKLVEACPCLANNSCGTSCKATSGESTPATLYQLYIQNVIAHELGHLIRPLHYPYSSKLENHYQEGKYLIMERSIVATRNRQTGVVTIPISKVYGPEDIGNIKLLP